MTLKQSFRNTFLQYVFDDRMGQGQAGIHALTKHQLKVIGIPTLTGAFQDTLIADTSKWNGGVNHAVMKANGISGVVIKCGQGVAKDPWFDRDYQSAKIANLPRSSYWFFDSRVSPYEQARLWVEFLKGDYGDLPHVADYEESYGGQYGGIENFHLFVAEFIRLSGLPDDKIAIYTGMYYWIGHTHRDYFEFFKRFWLFLAWYTDNAEQVIVPNPWTQEMMLWWQQTSNGDGVFYGSTGLDLDLSFHIKGKQDFLKRFNIIEEPETGEPMALKHTGRVKTTLTAPAVVRRTAGGEDTKERLPAGTQITGQGEIVAAGLYRWMNVISPIVGWVADHLLEYTTEQVTEPIGAKPRLALEFTDTDGKVWVLPDTELQEK